MRLNITESEMYYTNALDAIQDTIKKNFPNFDVKIARGKYPFVSVRVTKNANKNIHHRPSDMFVIRKESDGRITCTCDTYYDADFYDLVGIVNYFNDYLNDPNTENNRGYFESVRKRSRKRSSGLRENVSEKFEMRDLAQDINNVNNDKSRVDIKASLVQKQDSNDHWRVEVTVENNYYMSAIDSYELVVSNRGGYVMHFYHPTGSQWFDTKEDVINYFRDMVDNNID